MSKQIVEYHMNRLKDKSAQARIKAIQELVLLEAVEALPELESIFKSDPDEAVRKEAQKAGRELFLINRKKADT